MNNKKRLIILEGFDRAGKDSLLEDLKNVDLPDNTYIYEGFLDGLPSYNKERDKFVDWLNKLIDKQTNDIINLFNTYDTIIMIRLIVSDEVYSILFNREHTTIKYMYKLKDIEIFNYCLLFTDYDEYLKRLYLIGEKNIQYDIKSFNMINYLYKKILNDINYNFYINYINSDTTRNEVLNNFKKVIFEDKNIY